MFGMFWRVWRDSRIRQSEGNIRVGNAPTHSSYIFYELVLLYSSFSLPNSRSVFHELSSRVSIYADRYISVLHCERGSLLRNSCSP